jgi:stalled ribosome alternative rescue factor ArfA
MTIKKRNPYAKELRDDSRYHLKIVGAKKGRGSYERKHKYPAKSFEGWEG